MAKYEMKARSHASQALVAEGGALAPLAVESHTAVSTPEGQPWTNLDWAEAQAACAAVGGALPTNEQWNAIAREIERENENWTGGVVGSGTLYRGHSDAPGACGGPTSVSLAAAADEAPYAGTGNSELELSGLGKEQRRTHRLRSGEWIWDLSGNVWEFTQTRRSELGLTTPALPGPLGDLWTPFTGFTGAERAAVGFTLAEGPETGGGQFFWTTDLSTDPPINRGGSYCPYGSLTNTGIFTASVRADLRTARLRDLGFRCVVQ